MGGRWFFKRNKQNTCRGILNAPTSAADDCRAWGLHVTRGSSSNPETLAIARWSVWGSGKPRHSESCDSQWNWIFFQKDRNGRMANARSESGEEPRGRTLRTKEEEEFLRQGKFWSAQILGFEILRKSPEKFLLSMSLKILLIVF